MCEQLQAKHLVEHYAYDRWTRQSGTLVTPSAQVGRSRVCIPQDHTTLTPSPVWRDKFLCATLVAPAWAALGCVSPGNCFPVEHLHRLQHCVAGQAEELVIDLDIVCGCSKSGSAVLLRRCVE